MIFLVFLCLACAAAHRFGRRAAWTDAALLHAAVWLIACGTYAIFADDLIAPNDRALVVVGLGIASFSSGIWFTAKTTKVEEPRRMEMSPRAVALLALVAAIGFGAMLYQALDLVPLPARDPWLRTLRLAVSAPGRGFGFAAYLANAGFAAAFVAVLLARGRIACFLAASAAALAVGTAVLLTGRTFLLLISILIAVALLGRAGEPRRGAGWLLVAAAGCAALLALATMWQMRNAADAGGMLAALRFEWLHYVPVGLAAFGTEMAGSSFQGGVNTFRTVFAVLKAFGADVPVVPLVRPDVPVPFMTNVYTAFSPYYADFGTAGVMVIFVFLGAATGRVAARARDGHPVTVMLHAILLYALVMQFFQDQYASLASQWVQMLGLTFLFTLMARRTT